MAAAPIWNAAVCHIDPIVVTQLMKQSVRYCWGSTSVEVTCNHKNSLLDAAVEFMHRTLSSATGNSNLVQRCWPLLVSSALIMTMLDHPLVAEMDEVVSDDKVFGQWPDRSMPVSQLANLLVMAEEVASRSPEGLTFRKGSFDLRPGGLPFFSDTRNTRQLMRFHRSFSSAHLASCNSVGLRGMFSLRGQILASMRVNTNSPEIKCSAATSEDFLIARCHSRKQMLRTHVLNMTKSFNVKCPAPPGSDGGSEGDGEGDGEGKVEKYWMRQKWSTMYNHGWCEPQPVSAGAAVPGWLTGSSVQISWQKCSFHVIMEWIMPQPGSWFLDWGSACGHKLVWAKQYYGLHVVGVDYQRESVDWARRHAPASDLICHADGRDLTWLPDDFFEGALAFGAINYLNVYEQCDTALQIAKKLRPGARAVIGYNSMGETYEKRALQGMSQQEWFTQRPGHMLPPYESWDACFKRRKSVFNVNLRHDIMIENSWYLSGHSTERDISYALLLTRL